MVKKHGILYTYRNWISLLLLYLPYLLFSILLLLCFFCKPSAEDFAINYYSIHPGVSAFIKSFYIKEGSRYFSFPLVTLICHSRFMLDHYWIIPLCLMLFFWQLHKAAVNTLIRFLDLTIAPRWASWFSMVLTLALCSVVFEMSSFFYWMSGSVTYLPGYLLLILLVILLIKGFTNGFRKVDFISSSLLVLCISGTNEIGLYFLILFLGWISCLYFSIEKKISTLPAVCLLIALLSLFLLILPSGVSNRAGNYKIHFPVIQSLGISLGYTLRILFRTVSSPFAWITMVLAALAGFHTHERIKKKLINTIFFDPRILFLLLFTALMFFYFSIYLVSGELLAPRAQNLMVAYVFSILQLCCFAYGLRKKEGFEVNTRFYRQTSLLLLLVLVILSSSFTHSIIYNSFTGLLYNKVMKKRITDIRSALSSDHHSVVLYPYSRDFAEQAKAMMPSFLQPILKNKMTNFPDWMHFQDPLQDTARYIHYFAEYHHIDSIWYLDKEYERIGLSSK